MKSNYFKAITTHVKNHNGAMYIWFLMFVIFAVTVLSGVITFARLNITISNIKNEIEIASDAVLAEYKDLDYNVLRDPGDEITVTSPYGVYVMHFTKESFAKQLADELDNINTEKNTIVCNSSTITQFADSDVSDKKIYEIIIDDVSSSNDGMLTVTFTANIDIGIGGIIDVPFSETYIKTAQLYLKEY